jgi:hypothetical protein
MELAQLVDGLASGVGWPGSSKSALDPRRETVNQSREER